MTIRQINESPIQQGEDEEIAYRLDTTPWGGGPTNPVVVLKLYPVGTDVSLIHFTGAASVAADYVVTPQISDLDDGVVYRLEIMFDSAGNTYEAFAFIQGEL